MIFPDSVKIEKLPFSVGDMICYNAAGMKFKTIGLVVAIEGPRTGYEIQDVLILWCVTGEYMPRRQWGRGDQSVFGTNDKIKSGDLIWHPAGAWFEKAPAADHPRRCANEE